MKTSDSHPPGRFNLNPLKLLLVVAEATSSASEGGDDSSSSSSSETFAIALTSD